MRNFLNWTDAAKANANVNCSGILSFDFYSAAVMNGLLGDV